MSFFSKDLSFKAIVKNTSFGLIVLIDEWYWLIINSIYQVKLKKAKAKASLLSGEEEKIYLEHIEEFTKNHLSFREIQIKKRNKYLEL